MTEEPAGDATPVTRTGATARLAPIRTGHHPTMGDADRTVVTRDVVDRTPLAELRRRTAPWHRAVERAVGLLSPEVTTDIYGSVLAAFARVHATLDDDLVARAPAGLPYTARTPLLRRDLRDLGHPGEGPARPAAPVADTPARAFGARYVIEGSRLGGTLIVRHLRRALGFELPVRYLTVDGTDARPAWTAFTSVAARELRTAADVDDAADAAVAVFARLHDELVR